MYSLSYVELQYMLKERKKMMIKTDIEIAKEAKLLPIAEVAEKLDISFDELELYGKHKAKLTDELWDRVKDNKDGKLILVTAVNPTPA